jgi:hypothetical protein
MHTVYRFACYDKTCYDMCVCKSSIDAHAHSLPVCNGKNGYEIDSNHNIVCSDPCLHVCMYALLWYPYTHKESSSVSLPSQEPQVVVKHACMYVCSCVHVYACVICYAPVYLCVYFVCMHAFMHICTISITISAPAYVHALTVTRAAGGCKTCTHACM